MIHAIETYLTMRRAVGFELSNADYLLRSFASFAGERGEIRVRAATAIDWDWSSGIGCATRRAIENRLPLCSLHMY